MTPERAATYVDIEKAITRGADAKFWLNGGLWKNLKAMLDDDPRYKEFNAYRTGQVWFLQPQMNSAGTIDYFPAASPGRI